MTTETQQHPHHHHPHTISAPSAIGVGVIVLLCIGFVTTIAILLVRAVTPETQAAHIEGTSGAFSSRTLAHDESHRMVGTLLIREPGEVTTTPSNGTEDFANFRFGDSEMSLHLMPIEIQPGRWSVKWTADLRGTEARNREVINAWQAAANGTETVVDGGVTKPEK